MYAIPNPQTCQVNTSYCTFGCETILQPLYGFEKNINGVIENKDIECVHKTRVASRKLRAALPLFQFCFTPRKFRKWSKQIKRVTKLLGEARDLDVQIIFIQQYMQKQNSTEKESLNILLKGHRDRRNSIQSSVVAGLDRLKASNILQDIRLFCEDTISRSTMPFDRNQVLEKAQWHISFRLDDFLALREFVYKENEIAKHHQMRINAKKLRYTMEFFAPLYNNKLKKEIELIKSYQDILGEKHDLEVWMDFLPKFIDKIRIRRNTKKIEKAKIELALQNFLTYIKEERNRHYNQFVHLWDENKKSNFFDKLREVTKAGLTITEEKAKQVLANPNSRVAVFSDVHANLQALERVIKDAEERGVDMLVNAGDSIGFGPYPNEVIERLCEKNVLSILGNYDLEVIEGRANAKGEKKLAWKFARKELTESCECYLNSLPRELRLEAAGKKMLVTHGSPESIEEHIYHDTPIERLKTLAGCAKADLIIVGHSHEQFSRQANDAWFINPGSVGRPGDGNPQTAYAILTFSPFNVELIRLDYDVETATDALLKKGLPESFAQMLLRGVSLDTIVEEDNRKKDLTAQNCKQIMYQCCKFAQKYWNDAEHYLQVTNLALQFFDGLTNEHQLLQQERCWLECTANLHDIGLSKGRGQHNKQSAKIILNDTKLPFTSQERQIVASIARYHRKGLPKKKHYNLAGLDRVTIQKVKVLASLLRVADALDYTHQSNVKNLNFKVGTKKITVECISETPSILEEQSLNKKKDLFEKTFGKKLVLVWKQQ